VITPDKVRAFMDDAELPSARTRTTAAPRREARAMRYVEVAAWGFR